MPLRNGPQKQGKPRWVPGHGAKHGFDEAQYIWNGMGLPGTAAAAVAGHAVGAAAGTTFAPATVPDDLHDSQQDGRSDEQDEKDIEPHIRLPPTASR